MSDPLGVVSNIDNAMEQLWRVLFLNVGEASYCHGIYSIIVDLLLKEGEFERGLFEAKNLMAISLTDEQVKKAVDLLSVAAKASDGSIYRVNEFLAYERYGKPGKDGKFSTDDDLTDPFQSVTCSDCEERDARFKAAIKQIPRTWERRLDRAKLYVVWGRPLDALKELKIAFALCPADQESCQRVADRVVNTLTLITGEPKIGDSFVLFQKYGPNGADGKPQTDDDVKNPISMVLAAYNK